MQVWPKPVKLFSTGPIFRYEEPQAGRYRQHHQFNVEVIGVPGALADLEIMLLAWDIYDRLGFRNLAFQLNSTGCPACRPNYIKALQPHYHEHMDVICEECRRRLDQNPLRVLDCKKDQCQPVIAAAPKMTDMLCEECSAHFDELRDYLEALERPYILNHRLVRGLDYYTKTVFEVWAEGIGAQSAVCGGGRYDGLAEILGGPKTPGVGFAAGMERAVLVMKEQSVEVPELPVPPVFVAYLGDAARTYAVKLLTEIRALGVGVRIAMRGGLRSQLKQANRRASKLVIIIGEDELVRGEVTLRDMETGEQSMVPTTAIASILQERLGA